MAVHWRNSVVIDRPIDEIWAAFVDLFSAPRLPGSSMSLRQTTPGPMGVGTTILARRVILGFETRLIERITAWDPPNAISSTIEGRPFRSLVEHVTLETVPTGTRLTDTIDMELRLGLQLIWPVIGPFVTRQRRTQFLDLKKKLEAERPASSA